LKVSLLKQTKIQTSLKTGCFFKLLNIFNVLIFPCKNCTIYGGDMATFMLM